MTIHEPVVIHKRKRLPLGLRYEVLKRQCAPEIVAEVEKKGGKLKDKYAKLLMKATCALTGEPLIITGVEYDHIKPLVLGGTNEPENIRALAPKPHKEKTKDDIKRKSKADRQAGITGQYARRNRNGPKLRSNQKLNSRGFPSKEERERAKAWKEERREQ